MGWINETAPEHEGWLVGLVPATNPDGTISDWRYHELWSSAGDDLRMEIPLRVVQVGCDCGWRSPRLQAPDGTHYWPSYVHAPEWFEDACRLLWREHIARDVHRVRKGVIVPPLESSVVVRK
jgi:hypothetical protein